MNNKKNNRKGFTIVELVIVIAVIAILATVLVPTFGNVIGNAKKTAALQEAKNVYTNYVANFNYQEGTPVDDLVIKVDDYYVAIVDGSVTGEATTEETAKATVAEDLEEENEGATITWGTATADGFIIPAVAPAAQTPVDPAG